MSDELSKSTASRPAVSDASDLERMKAMVVMHFDDFVNRKDLSAIDRNMALDFLDHDGPGGRPTGVDGDREMMAQMHQLFPDLHVQVRDVIAEGDKVVVRNVWTGTNARTGAAMWFQGFVMWRFAAGKIVERWATVTAPASVNDNTPVWPDTK